MSPWTIPLLGKICPATITGKYMQNYKNLWDLYINNSATNPADLAAGGFDAQAEFAEGQGSVLFSGQLGMVRTG